MTTQPDYSNLPYYPAPWDDVPLVAGWSVNGFGNIPTSKAEAARWAATYAKLGARVYRAHKVHTAFNDNPTSHLPRFQWLLDALKKRGIPVLMEVQAAGLSPQMVDQFDESLAHIAKLDLSNVVGIAPYNEIPVSGADWLRAESKIRGIGYKGLIFGSNSAKQGGEPGDLVDIHAYCGLEVDEKDPPGTYFETLYKDEDWNHPKGPVDIATEIGHPPPATTRARSEDQIIDVLFDRGCRVFILFALLDRPELWKLSTDKELRLEACCQDPLRMETWRRLVQRCVGPSVNLSGVQCEQVDRGKWRVVS